MPLILLALAATSAMLTISISPDLERSARYNVIGAVLSTAVTLLTAPKDGEPNLLCVGFAYAGLLLSTETIIIATYFIVTTLAQERRERAAKEKRK